MTFLLAVLAVALSSLGWRFSSSESDLVVRNIGRVWFGFSGLMFGIRPITELLLGTPNFLGTDLTETYSLSLFIGFLGISGSAIGWKVSQYGLQLGLPHATELGAANLDRVLRALLLVQLLLLGLLLFSAARAGQLSVLFGGRSTARNNFAIGSSGILYESFLLGVPISMLGIAKASKLVNPWSVYGGAIVALGALAGGSRIYLLILAATLVSSNPRKVSAPKNFFRSFFTVLLLLWLVVGVRTARSAEDDISYLDTVSPTWWLENGADGLANSLLGADLEMVNFLAFQAQEIPDSTGFFHGSFFRDVAIRSVPRPLWPGKPAEGSQLAIEAVQPGRTEAFRAASASSVFGALYIDSGLAFVLGGSAALTFTLRHVTVIARHRRTFVYIFSAALPGATLILIRGTLAHAMSTSFFLIFLPVIIAAMLSRSVDLNVSERSRLGAGNSGKSHESVRNPAFENGRNIDRFET